jgi:hypothetical protein
VARQDVGKVDAAGFYANPDLAPGRAWVGGFTQLQFLRATMTDDKHLFHFDLVRDADSEDTLTMRLHFCRPRSGKHAQIDEYVDLKFSLWQTAATFLVFLSASAGARLVPADFRPY